MQFHLLLAFGIASVAGTPLVAADKPPQREVPLFVANLAGADRLLKDSDRLFRLIERRDLGLALKATIALSTSGLKGVDRKRPLGLMTLIDPGEAPEPVGVVYVPIANAKDFLEALAALRVDVKPAGNGYALKWNGESYAMRIQQRYAFLARRMKSLKRKFGDPAVDFAALSNAYDAAIRIQLDAVPKELRWMILDYARASAAIGLQRRPGESVVDHRLRKSLGMLALAGMAELLRDGRSLTIGVALKKPRTSAVLEMRMAAKRDSALSRGLADLAPQAGKRRPSKPASSHLVVNWKPPASLRPVADSLLGAMPQGNRRDAKAAARIWTTVRDGWFDSGILVSIRSADKSPAVVVRVGMPAKRKNGDRLRRLLGDLQRAGAIRKLKPNAVRNRRGVFHRFEWNGGPADWTLSGLTAASNDSLWLAVGVAEVEAALKTDAAPQKASGQMPADRNELLRVSIRWSVLQAALSNDRSFWSALVPSPNAKRPAADRVHLSITRKREELIVRARLEEDVLRQVARSLAGRFARPVSTRK